MALSSKQQQFLDNYVRKHSIKGKGKTKRASAFSLVRQQTVELLKAQPWLLPENPAFRTRLDDADALGEQLKFDRASVAMGQLLADLKQAVQNRPQAPDPKKTQAGDPARRLQLRNQRDAIVNANDWTALSTGGSGGDLKIMRARLTPLLDRDPFTAAQLEEARTVIDELTVKRDFLRQRKAEIDKRILQLNKYALQLQTANQAYPNVAVQQLAQKAQTLAGKAAATWTRADENEATSLYLDMMLALSERDNVDHKNFKEGQGGEIVLAVRRKYKTDNNQQPLPDEANFKMVVKPMTAEIPVDGFKAGGGASREMMGSVMGDKLQEMLGIDLNVAKTRLVKVDGAQIGLQGGGQTTASVQAFVKGGISPMDQADQNIRARGVTGKIWTADAAKEALSILNTNVSDDEIQGKAVFDLIALHADRHMGNFLLDANNKLVPIDHGNILPTREGLRGRRSEMGPPHAILAATDAAQEKLSPEMADRVERLNIDELMAGMKTAHEEMRRVTPDADVGDLDEGLANARRSAEFMKFAARQLTVAQVYACYSKNFEDIFCTEEDDKLAGFTRAVVSQTDDTTARDTLKQRGSDEEHRKTVWDLGWMRWGSNNYNPLFVSTMLPNYPERVLEILDKQLAAPALKAPPGMAPCPNDVKVDHWNFYWALGGDAAAKRLGLLGEDNIGNRNQVMALRLAVTGKLP
ncbi:hypothetical protein [Pseudorhodoferax sp. Leaf274]|uniref:hypothetical protein n=1 Tax=Pseudorhodoferax sp. Leaf274 TaxID=1736318 RepID=UPI000702E348|nr:hypothetical protein [Pseudorhodoferax sp. Leaf274]KQP35421.1 hypothetical protein ASF44_18935 [Pseudorhodoferax sp. Leaf274]